MTRNGVSIGVDVETGEQADVRRKVVRDVGLGRSYAQYIILDRLFDNLLLVHLV